MRRTFECVREPRLNRGGGANSRWAARGLLGMAATRSGTIVGSLLKITQDEQDEPRTVLSSESERG